MTGKLYGTLGPACADTDTLRALLRAGMRGVRLNLSHGPLEERAGDDLPRGARRGAPIPQEPCCRGP